MIDHGVDHTVADGLGAHELSALDRLELDLSRKHTKVRRVQERRRKPTLVSSKSHQRREDLLATPTLFVSKQVLTEPSRSAKAEEAYDTLTFSHKSLRDTREYEALSLRRPVLITLCASRWIRV